jgi:cell fate (sporulation/competence/biofilm development) regulator YlbF (YheA/YmcA/DUF963 family)
MEETSPETLLRKKLIEVLKDEFNKLKESVDEVIGSGDSNDEISVEELGKVYRQLDKLKLVVSELIRLSAKKDG